MAISWLGLPAPAVRRSVSTTFRSTANASFESSTRTVVLGLPGPSYEDMQFWTRRKLLRSMLGLPAAVLAGCRPSRTPSPALTGQIVGASLDLGHHLRDAMQQRQRPPANVTDTVHTRCVIVGGGVAGYSAARRLIMAGMSDFVLLELEPQPGGQARGGRSRIVPFPWGAHYLPIPMKENRSLVSLLEEIGVVQGRDVFDEPVVALRYLCREPEERLFADGGWQRGFVDRDHATPQEQTEFQAFDQLVDRWVRWRDADGRRAFAIPLADCSPDPHVTQLDQISMAQWLDDHDLRSPRLRWYIDYCCRDDYGLRTDQTSAWAGLFYFASRIRRAGDASQPLITWPEGNARLIAHLHQMVSANVRLGLMATRILPSTKAGETVRVIAMARPAGPAIEFRAPRVIFAVPQFLRRHLVPQQDETTDLATFEYGSWLVANLHLSDRPREGSVPLCWDNVLRDSPSLGYVVATHQQQRATGPTVFTYYYPFCDDNPAVARARLMEMDWAACAEMVLSDLEAAHPDLRSLVQRLDVMRWGHAMIQARPGFIWSPARSAAAQPDRQLHFANSDLSGLPLFEEAFYHGNRAAEEVLSALDVPFESVL